LSGAGSDVLERYLERFRPEFVVPEKGRGVAVAPVSGHGINASPLTYELVKNVVRRHGLPTR
jgi:hypothetical protein